jgi:predicted phosphodiesterase
MRILHISDPHGEGETMERLEMLVKAQEDCDVVALTGDCTCGGLDRLPGEWNSWPQSLLLSVPGNHDKAYTFDELHSWTHQAPWVTRLHDLLFLGIKDFAERPLERLILERGCAEWEGCRAVVLLSHYKPPFESSPRLAEILASLAQTRPLLVLHGHEHPPEFSGAEWDDSGRLGSSMVYRSKIYTAKRGKKGLGHRIDWDGQKFTAQEVQGGLPRRRRMWFE